MCWHRVVTLCILTLEEKCQGKNKYSTDLMGSKQLSMSKTTR